MITLTKEWLLKTIAELEEERDAMPGAVNEDAAMALEAMKRALASLEAEPVAWIVHARTGDQLTTDGGYVANAEGILGLHSTPLYTTPPTPVSVPDGEWGIDHSAGRPILVYKGCSVIEAEDAEYVLSLIAKDGERAAPPCLREVNHD